MSDTIVKTFIGKYIDLSKVVSISDAYFINRMGHGGYFVGFEIHCQLLEQPIKYERMLDWGEEGKGRDVKMVDGECAEPPNIFHGNQYDKDILAVHNLQKQIDELVEQWRSVNK